VAGRPGRSAPREIVLSLFLKTAERALPDWVADDAGVVTEEIQQGLLHSTFCLLTAFAPLFFLSVGLLGWLAAMLRPERLDRIRIG